MANWANSTQRSNWIFDPQVLNERRSSVLEASIAGATPAAPGAEPVEPITHAEALLLQRYYEGKILEVCSALRLPSKVKGAALNFFKRFILTRGPLELDQKAVMLTCVYLACKVEESYIGAEELAKAIQQSEATLLTTERPLLEGLHFQLVTYSPYRSVNGLLVQLSEMGTLPEDYRDFQFKAYKAVDKLMLSDAPLLYPPGLIALGAIVYVADRDASLGGPVREFAAGALKQAAGSGEGRQPRAQSAASSEASLAAICLLADAAPLPIDEAGAIDRKLKLWRKVHPKVETSADGAKKASKAEARARQADLDMAAFDGMSPLQEGVTLAAGVGSGGAIVTNSRGAGADDEKDGSGDARMRSPKRRRSEKGPEEAGDAVMASV